MMDLEISFCKRLETSQNWKRSSVFSESAGEVIQYGGGLCAADSKFEDQAVAGPRLIWYCGWPKVGQPGKDPDCKLLKYSLCRARAIETAQAFWPTARLADVRTSNGRYPNGQWSSPTANRRIKRRARNCFRTFRNFDGIEEIWCY